MVLAPHGGHIEPGSSRIAKAIAETDHSSYCFEGVRRGRAHGELHITSCRFDEPMAVDLVTAANTAVAVHGRADGHDLETVWMGGRDIPFRDAIAAALGVAGFPIAIAGHPLPGTEPANICNRGKSGAGVQLELPLSLRNRLVGDPAALVAFAAAVRQTMANR